MVYCVVLQEILPHGLGASPTMEVPPELLHAGRPCIFSPQVHCPVPPAHPSNTALVMCSLGKVYHEPGGVQTNPVLGHAPALSLHAVKPQALALLHCLLRSSFPDPQLSLSSPSSTGWIIPQASFLWLPHPLHPPRKECSFAKARQEQSRKEQFCIIFFSGPF